MRHGGVAGLLLAAGAGTRLGTPKATLELAGERLVDRGVRVLEEGGCHPVVVVLGAATLQVRRAVTVRNPDWRSGMGSSLRLGLQALPADAQAVVIALVDQPFVEPLAVRKLIESGAGVAVATYGGRPRNPVLIAREHFGKVMEHAVGDVGARTFLKAYPELVTHVEVPGDPVDIDTPDDLKLLPRLSAELRPSGRG
jgi:CTP:molybdopterin cytidylyltransferase MocA